MPINGYLKTRQELIFINYGGRMGEGRSHVFSTLVHTVPEKAEAEEVNTELSHRMLCKYLEPGLD